MGFFLSGLAINKNYSNETDVLYSILNMDVVKTEEITFEKAIESPTDLFYFDVYFTSKGTLVLLNDDLCMDSYLVDELNSLSFIISEHSDSYMMHYSENGKNKFDLTKVAGRLTGNGKKLIKDTLTIEELIYQYIENTLGKRFFDIENEEKIIRCYVSNYDWKKEEEINKTNHLEPLDLKHFTEPELLDKFDDIVLYCKTNNINFFLHPSLHEPQNQKVIQNLIDLKSYIGFNENLLKVVKLKFPDDGYYMIGKFKKENLDSKTTALLFDLVKNGKYDSKTKKIVFNKKLDDKHLFGHTDLISLILVLLFALALLGGLIYAIYGVVTLLN